MSFLWPGMLWLLLGVPVVIALYGWLLRRKKLPFEIVPLPNGPKAGTNPGR